MVTTSPKSMMTDVQGDACHFSIIKTRASACLTFSLEMLKIVGGLKSLRLMSKYPWFPPQTPLLKLQRCCNPLCMNRGLVVSVNIPVSWVQCSCYRDDAKPRQGGCLTLMCTCTCCEPFFFSRLRQTHYGAR